MSSWREYSCSGYKLLKQTKMCRILYLLCIALSIQNENFIIQSIALVMYNTNIRLSKDKSKAEHGEYVSKRSKESDMLR